MGGAEIRGFLAFAAVVAAIAYAWVQLDREPTTKALASAPVTSTTLPALAAPTTTKPPEVAAGIVCDVARTFVSDVAAVPDDAGPGPVAELAAEFWATILPDLPDEIRTEAVAVSEYYNAFVSVAQPFEYDPVRVIIEGDKERYEQLLTRPAPGLESAGGYLLFECGVEHPPKPSMSASGFRDLEERLLDPDPLDR